MSEMIELDVCVDCLMLAAGYDAHELGHEIPQAVLDAPARIARDNSVERVTVVPEDGEGHFSWSPCELCLSTLGGDRFRVTVILEAGAL